MIKRWLIVICALSVAATSMLAQQESPGAQKNTAAGHAMMVHDLLSVSTISQWWGRATGVSPDGRQVVFQARRSLLEQNQYAHDLWLADTAGKAAPRQIVRDIPGGYSLSLKPLWSPDSQMIAYLSPKSDEIRLIHPDGQKEEALTRREDWREGFQEFSAGAITEFKWSPDGKWIAFIVNATANKQEFASTANAIEADVEWHPLKGKPSLGLLCAIQVNDRKVRRLTDGALNAASFDWSPDGKQLVISANEDTDWASHMRTDLYVMDLQSGKARTLVKQEGRDVDPIWSKDGKWIAFASQRGKEDWTYTTWLAVVSASGGNPTYLTDAFLKGSGGSPREIFWSADSKQIYFNCFYRMSSQLFRVPLDGGSVERVTLDDGRYYANFSYSGDSNVLAFTAESVTEPPEVYRSSPAFTDVKKLTDLNPQLNKVAHAKLEMLSWRSRDGKWDVHGVLVKPPDYQPGKKYPLLVLLQGGPSMVRMEYGLNMQYPVEIFAARGYLVFSPNTRGRGGYGYGFAHAIGDEKSYGTKPLEDALAGVDELIKRGIADPDRLGIMGNSYGGYLTALAITQTNRFKAASVNEAHVTDLLQTMFVVVGRPNAMKLYRDMYGIGAPFDPAEMKLIISQSPVHQLKNVTTPTLLEFGDETGRPERALPLFQGLQYLKVPSELIVYKRTGHGWEALPVREESFNRVLEWFDYWVLGKATGRMASKYGVQPRQSLGRNQ